MSEIKGLASWLNGIKCTARLRGGDCDGTMLAFDEDLGRIRMPVRLPINSFEQNLEEIHKPSYRVAIYLKTYEVVGGLTTYLFSHYEE